MTNSVATTRLIPREVLFGNPERTMPRLSPDGQRMAYLAPVNNVLNVWVGTVGQDNYQPITADTERGIRNYFWAYDNKHILYLQDVGGNENWRLYAVDLSGGSTRDLTPFDTVQAQVVGLDKHHPGQLLVGLNREDARKHDVYRLELETGELTLAATNPGNVLGWLADAELEVRCGIAAQPDAGISIMVRESGSEQWQPLFTVDSEDALTTSPQAFSRDGRYLFLSDSRQVNAARLVKLNLADQTSEVLAEDPQYDVGSVLVDPDTYEPKAVSFVRARTEWQVLDPSLQADFDRLAGLHRGDFSIISRDLQDKVWLVAYSPDNGPVAYYAYNRASQSGTFLFVNQPALMEYTLSEMEPISFESRDGLTIHGYLTMPAGAARQNLPTVLYVHGGPWGRDGWGWRPDVQHLANRGYAVLQVNFRGSTGYGKAFVNAGDREWGAKMHNDLVDAVEWAVGQGYTDPTRVAIFGGSYGGYAALVGATFTPDLFTCAVDVVGPSNLRTLIETIPPYWTAMRQMLIKRVGDPDNDPEFVRERSPLYKADRIKIPMLIAQGANDPRVKQEESEQIVEAMRKNGVDFDYMLFPDEGHGFVKPENRLKFNAALEKFLAQHLGGRFEE